MDLMTRRTSFAPPASLDTEARSFSATVATSAPVRRPPPTPDGSPEPWDEVLSLDPRHVDLSRLVGGPLLLGHDQARHLGVITGARIENGVLIADLKLSRRAEADQTLQDIADRVIQQVSAGFTVQSWRRQPSAAAGAPRYHYCVIKCSPYRRA